MPHSNGSVPPPNPKSQKDWERVLQRILPGDASKLIEIVKAAGPLSDAVQLDDFVVQVVESREPFAHVRLQTEAILAKAAMIAPASRGLCLAILLVVLWQKLSRPALDQREPVEQVLTAEFLQLHPGLVRDLVLLRTWRPEIIDRIFDGLAAYLRGQPGDCFCVVAEKVLLAGRQWYGRREPEVDRALRPLFGELDKRLRQIQADDPALDAQWQKLEGVAFEQFGGQGFDKRLACLREHWRRYPPNWAEGGSVDDDDDRSVPNLDSRQAESICRYSRLKRIWSRYAVIAYWHNTAELSEQTRCQLRDFGAYEWKQLRLATQEVNRYIRDDERLNLFYQFVWNGIDIRGEDGSLRVLGCFGGLWRAVRAWLLVFRELRLPAVEADLAVPPPAREIIPGPAYNEGYELMQVHLAHLLHSRFRFEEEADPYLRELRTEFARFCIGRLKTVRKNSKRYGDAMQNLDDAPLVEADAVWREGYLRAAMAVQAPDLKGHDFDVLRRAGSYDPDENVRSSACELYKQLHATEELPDETRRRRLIFAGLWEIRRAHRRALGLCVDERAAQSIRDREARETTAPWSIWNE